MSMLSIILIAVCAACIIKAFSKDSKAWAFGFIMSLTVLALDITGNL